MTDADEILLDQIHQMFAGRNGIGHYRTLAPESQESNETCVAVRPVGEFASIE